MQNTVNAGDGVLHDHAVLAHKHQLGKGQGDDRRDDDVKEQIKRVKGLDIQEKHLLFPIPQTEFNYNEALDPSKDQNPGY